jgi:hypothetical protein
MGFKNRAVDAVSLLLGVVCAACGAEQGGAQTDPIPLQRISETAEGPSGMSTASAPVNPASQRRAAGEVIVSPQKRSCTTDPECAPDFCDRGVCATPGKAFYGRDGCEPDPPPRPPLPPPPPGMRWGPKAGFSEPDCGGYHCIDGRCRSCRSDAECGGGDLVCQSVPDFPGRSCGRVLPDEPPGVRHDPPPMPPMLGEGAGDLHPPDPSGRQILQDQSQFQPPPPPPKPSK